MSTSDAELGMEAGARHLRAGAVTVEYAGGSLRYIRCQGREVLRQIYVAVRDLAWATPAMKIVKEHIEQGSDWFRIRFEADVRHGDIDFRWTGAIDGTADDRITFDISGVAAASFQTNRIGFCVLHPVEGCAGQACWIEHTSGVREESNFPSLISPHQPFLDVREISHEIAPALLARVRMEGDVFETEDHRNWTDDSLKSYSRPLALPYPFEVKVGETVHQTVTVSVEGAGNAVRIALRSKERGRLPEIALERIDLHLDSAGWRQELGRRSTETPAEFAVFTSGDASEVDALIAEFQRVRPAVKRMLLFNDKGTTSPPNAQAIRESMRTVLPGIPIGGGTSANFAELNRKRRSAEGLDFACWGINPQIHAADDQTLIENLQAQEATVQTARSFCGEQPVAISPVTIPHPTPAAAPWMIACIANLARSGVQSATFLGIQGADRVLRLIEDFAGGEVIAASSSDPLRAGALALVKGKRVRLLLANFLDRAQDIVVEGEPMRTIPPYGVTVVDREAP